MHKPIKNLLVFSSYLALLLIFFLFKNYFYPVSESSNYMNNIISWKSTVSFFEHTPLFYYLAYFLKNIIKDPLFSMHFISIFCIALVAFLTFIFVKIFKSERDAYFVGLLILLYPPLFNGVLINDIDTSVGLVLVFVFCVQLVKYKFENFRDHLSLCLTLMLGFFFKEFIGVILFIAGSGTLVYRFKLQKGLKIIFKTLVPSMVLSIVVYLIFAHYMYGNLGAFQVWTTRAVEHSKLASFSLKPLLLRMVSFVGWANPLLLFFIFLSFIKGDVKKHNKISAVFCSIYLLFYLYAWKGPGGFPKYFMPIFPLLIIMMFTEFKDKIFNKYVLLWIFLLSSFYFVFGDYMLLLSQKSFKGILFWGWWYFLFIIILILFVKFINKKFDYKKILLVFFVSQSIALFTVQLKVDYSTSYWYGTTGLNELIKYMDENNILFGEPLNLNYQLNNYNLLLAKNNNSEIKKYLAYMPNKYPLQLENTKDVLVFGDYAVIFY